MKKTMTLKECKEHIKLDINSKFKVTHEIIKICLEYISLIFSVKRR